MTSNYPSWEHRASLRRRRLLGRRRQPVPANNPAGLRSAGLCGRSAAAQPTGPEADCHAHQHDRSQRHPTADDLRADHAARPGLAGGHQPLCNLGDLTIGKDRFRLFSFPDFPGDRDQFAQNRALCLDHLPIRIILQARPCGTGSQPCLNRLDTCREVARRRVRRYRSHVLTRSWRCSVCARKRPTALRRRPPIGKKVASFGT